MNSINKSLNTHPKASYLPPAFFLLIELMLTNLWLKYRIRQPYLLHSVTHKEASWIDRWDRRDTWFVHRSILNPIVSILTISSPFNPLFKVLFIFRSRYLFAIGLRPVFSFTWNLPRNSVIIPKITDSKKRQHSIEIFQPYTGLSPSLALYSKRLMLEPEQMSLPKTTIRAASAARF